MVGLGRIRGASTIHVTGVQSDGAHEVKLCERVSGQGSLEGGCLGHWSIGTTPGTSSTKTVFHF